MNAPTTPPGQELLDLTLTFCEGCLSRQDFTAAWQALCRAVSLAPSRADVLSHRGRLALFLRDTQTAQRDYAAALKLDPLCSSAWSGLARYYAQQGDLAEAEIAADRALSIDPADEDAAQVKVELQAARRKARPREASSTYPRAPSAAQEVCAPNAGAASAPGFADWDETSEPRVPSRAAGSQPLDVRTDYFAPQAAQQPNGVWAASTQSANVRPTATPKPIFTFAVTRPDNHATAAGSKPVSPQETP